MKNFSQKTLEALAAKNAILCTHTKITRKDGHVVRMVDLDQISTVDGQSYYPGGGERTAIKVTATTDADNVDITGLYKEGLIERDDLMSGLYDFAEVEIFLAFFGNPDLDIIPMVRGVFGDVDIRSGDYTIKVEGLTHALKNTVGIFTGPTCRAFFGDSQCKINLADHNVKTTITAIIDPRTFSVGVSDLTNYNAGLMKIASGTAAGQSGEIRTARAGTVTTYLPFVITPKVGDMVTLIRGCNKSRATCRDVYDNLNNFRGEPDLPGTDEILSPSIKR